MSSDLMAGVTWAAFIVQKGNGAGAGEYRGCYARSGFLFPKLIISAQQWTIPKE